MIFDSICFEPDNIDKHIDYNFSLETSYYCSQYSSPTPSTPLGSPTSSLILDDMTVHQHQQSLSLSSTSTTSSSSMVPIVPQQQPLHNDFGNNDDWLLDPFYDVGSFSYQPLAISPAETNELMNAAAQSLNCPQFQQSMIMAESNEIPIGSLVSPHSSCTTVENPGTNNYQQRQHHPSTYSIKLENTLPLLTESSSTALPQAKPQSKNSYNAMSSPITARDLNIEYPTTSHYASSNGSTPLVTPTSSTSSSSVTRPRKKKARQSPSSFQCDFPGCQKSFTRPYNLNSHRRTHTNEKPFDCPHCPKTFARQHDRNRHAKLHSGVKPFLCLFCSKSFARQDALSRHQLWSDEHKVIGCSILNRKNGKDSSTTK